MGGNKVQLNHEILINSSAEKVWDVLSNLERVAHYNPTVASARYVSEQKVGVGSARECQLKPSGLVKERVVAVEEGRSITMELYESDWPVENMTWTTTIHPEGNATMVKQTMSYTPKGLIGKIMNFLMMKKNIDKTVGDIFVSLKHYVEKG